MISSLRKVTQKILRSLRSDEGSTTVPPWRLRDWTIGIYDGPSPLALRPLPGAANPILGARDVTDVPAVFVADPFMIRAHSLWHMFFEVLNESRGKGEIGLAISTDGVRWKYRQVVLREQFHVAYPHVFQWKGEYFMVPETEEVRSVRLYRAVVFPSEWVYMSTLLSGGSFKDASLLHHEGKWWLFAETDEQYRFDTLRLYFAENVDGPWSEHAGSPIVSRNQRAARPAGRIVICDGRIIRFTQDCQPVYGSRIRAFEITELTTKRYREQEVAGAPEPPAEGDTWKTNGMHHVDAHELESGRWMACVDAWAWNPLYRPPT